MRYHPDHSRFSLLVKAVYYSYSMYYVYVLESKKNQRKYIGYTAKNPNERLKEHNSGANSFTRRNRPYEIIYSEEYKSESFARKREKYFKSGTGRRVLNRILDKSRPGSSVG